MKKNGQKHTIIILEVGSWHGQHCCDMLGAWCMVPCLECVFNADIACH